MKTVVLLSGGIDSSTALAWAKSEGYDLYALSFDYQQRHRRELESARMVAKALGVRKHLTVHFDLRDLGGSALTSDIEVPKSETHASVSPETASKIPVTYVPARNTIFLSFAIAWAEVLGAEPIYIGANAVDYSGYPDCRPEYLQAFEDMANLATRASVEGRHSFHIRAPLISMKKSDIIRKGVQLGLDYSLTWSCYDPQPGNSRELGVKYQQQEDTDSNAEQGTCISVPCGACDSCRIREKGFREAGIADPLLLTRDISQV